MSDQTPEATTEQPADYQPPTYEPPTYTAPEPQAAATDDVQDQINAAVAKALQDERAAQAAALASPSLSAAERKPARHLTPGEESALRQTGHMPEESEESKTTAHRVW